MKIVIGIIKYTMYLLPLQRNMVGVFTQTYKHSHSADDTYTIHTQNT